MREYLQGWESKDLNSRLIIDVQKDMVTKVHVDI